MKIISAYFRANQVRLLCALAVIAGLALGAIDPATASLGVLVIGDTQAMDEILRKALAEHGVSLKQFAENFRASLKEHSDELKTQRTQIIELAQKMSPGAPGLGGGGGGGASPLADILTKADGYKDLREGKIRDLRIPIPGGLKTQIVNASGASQPLVPADRVELVGLMHRSLRIRDLIPATPTTSNTVEFPQQSTYSNNARPQGDASPGNVEGEELAESAMTFTLQSAAVVTIGHWIPASRQVLDDSKVLGDFLDNELLYGLKLKEETDILTGDGTAGKLSGLTNQATAYNRGATNDTMLDTLAKAKCQLQLADAEPTGLVLAPADYLTMVTSKDSNLKYLWSDPAGAMVPTVWSLPIVVSNSMTSGKFLMGDFQRACRIWDRQDAMVEFSTSHENFFVKLMVAVRAWERIALTVPRPLALVYGDVSHAG